MIHLGDITKISGYDVPVVDCIIGGSPCQDLSVAGKRAGLNGERSGLFMEQIRIIKEMREASERTTGIHRPRFTVWENVPGALSSNKGKDFRVVLEEFAHIADKNAVIPESPKGKWSTAGAVMGDGWSIAWRVLDAQFWGVPQRRRRIALVADFGGQSAPEILFERESVSGDTAESRTQEERAAGSIETSIDSTICLQGNSIDRTEHSGCCGKGWRDKIHLYLTNADGKINQNQITCLMDQGGSVMYALEGISGTLRAQEHGHQPLVYDARGNGSGETVCTITGDHQNRITDYTDLVAVHGQTVDKTVRRLTPLECERLQGYPDGWTDIGEWTDSQGKSRKASDSARYKALGNSIALPPWKWVLKRLCSCYERDATMASLFDGIGGFPLIWEEINGSGSCLWASEIEEFPIAVTKLRFGG